MVASVPRQGGATWAVLQYVLGLRALGHEVLLVDPLLDRTSPAGNGRSVEYFREVVECFHLDGRAALISTADRRSVGLSFAQVAGELPRADVLLNLAGTLRMSELTDRIPVRVYLDLDPAFTQLWHAAERIDMGFDGHTHFVTVGHRVGTPASSVPTCGRAWLTSWPPVVLSEWRPLPGSRDEAFTTIANWRSYGSIEYRGVFHGQKAHALRELIALPRQTGERFRLALAIDPHEQRDLEALHASGWELVDPVAVAGTPDAYRDFVSNSWAEVGVTKSGYVVSRSGWFSERSACYLAAGRPVVAQETGFSAHIETGDGLFVFQTIEQFAAAAAHIRADYRYQRQKAREVAEEYFDSAQVLTRLLHAVGVAA